jgi:hypothetical protein
MCYVVAQFVIADGSSQYYLEIVTSSWKEQTWSEGLKIKLLCSVKQNKTDVLNISF